MDIIPAYNGNPIALNPFIAACDAMFTKFGISQEDQEFLFHAIISKLRGDVQTHICAKTELNTWPLVKQQLSLTFGDPRKLENITQDIIHTKIKKNESLQAFSNRMLELENLLLTKLKISNHTRDEKIALTSIYSKLCLDAYTANMNSEYRLMIRIKNPNSLKEAIKFLHTEDQFKQYEQ